MYLIGFGNEYQNSHNLLKIYITDQLFLSNDKKKCFQKAVLPNDGSQRAKKLAVSAEPTNFEQTKQATLQHHSKSAGYVILYFNIFSNFK